MTTGRDDDSARGRWRWVGPIASLVIFAASVTVLWYIAQEIDPEDMSDAFAAATKRQLWLAAGFTILSYLFLSGYDALALKGLGIKMRLRTTSLASFCSYAVSFTLGFSLMTAGTVRYWIYAPRGLRASEVAQLTLIAGLTFWLGMSAVFGVTLLYSAADVAKLARTTPFIMQVVGIGVLAGALGYLFWVIGGRRQMQIRNWKLNVPGFRITLAQMLLGAGDVCAGAAVLYVLLPSGSGIAYEAFLAAYVFAALVGIVSHTPGGLGVFEATMLVALASLPTGQVIGALLLFRLFYYLAPFVVALALLGLLEIVRRIRVREV
jgi:glycosyltransferase 2 family protein